MLQRCPRFLLKSMISAIYLQFDKVKLLESLHTVLDVKTLDTNI